MDNSVIGRLVGVDYGSRRIGLAISDPERRIASPADVIDAAPRVAASAARVADWARVREATAFVVGLPLNMDGTSGTQAKQSEQFASELRIASALPVSLYDERLSSYQADQLRDAGDMRGKRRAARRDALAAMVILQSFLDRARGG